MYSMRRRIGGRSPAPQSVGNGRSCAGEASAVLELGEGRHSGRTQGRGGVLELAGHGVEERLRELEIRAPQEILHGWETTGETEKERAGGDWLIAKYCDRLHEFRIPNGSGMS